jgi:hypothetical protein
MQQPLLQNDSNDHFLIAQYQKTAMDLDSPPKYFIFNTSIEDSKNH